MARPVAPITLAVVILAAAACAGPAAPGGSAARASAPPSAGTGSPSASPSASFPPYQKAVVPPVDVAHLRTGPAHPVVAVAYPFDVYAHCGAELVRFGGSGWRAEQPLAISWFGYLPGTMELLDADTARFVLDLRYVDPQYFTLPPAEVTIYHTTTDDPRCM